MRKKGIILENSIDIPLIRLFFLHALALDLDNTAGGILETGNHTQCRCFPTTGRAKQGQEFSLPDFQIHILDDMIVAVPFIDVLDRNNRIRQTAASSEQIYTYISKTSIL